MVVWGLDDVSRGQSTAVRPAQRESLEVIGDARSWGFDHGIRQPRPVLAANAFPVR